jgi:hypothetical protein
LVAGLGDWLDVGERLMSITELSVNAGEVHGAGSPSRPVTRSKSAWAA